MTDEILQLKADVDAIRPTFLSALAPADQPLEVHRSLITTAQRAAIQVTAGKWR